MSGEAFGSLRRLHKVAWAPILVDFSLRSLSPSLFGYKTKLKQDLSNCSNINLTKAHQVNDDYGPSNGKLICELQELDWIGKNRGVESVAK